MGDKTKSSKVMFYAGILFIIVAVILLLGNFMGESTFPTILGFLGVLFISASNMRLLK